MVFPLFLLAAQLQIDKFAGTYRAELLDAKGRIVGAKIDPRSAYSLNLKKDRRWTWGNGASGLDGTWIAANDFVRLLPLSLGNGKPADPQTMVLKSDPTGRRLRLVSPKMRGYRLSFLRVDSSNRR